MKAPTRPLRGRLKPLCTRCLRSSCTATRQWPRACRGPMRQPAPTSVPAQLPAGEILTRVVTPALTVWVHGLAYDVSQVPGVWVGTPVRCVQVAGGLHVTTDPVALPQSCSLAPRAGVAGVPADQPAPVAPAQQFTSGLADVRAGRMLTNAQAGLIARRNAELVEGSVTMNYRDLADKYRLSPETVLSIIDRASAATVVGSVAVGKPAAPGGAEGKGAILGGLRPMVADGAAPVARPVACEHDLLAGLEARLADEVHHLVYALARFAKANQAIGKELPSGSQSGKLITLFFSSLSFQVMYELLKNSDKLLLLDDGFQPSLSTSVGGTPIVQSAGVPTPTNGVTP